MEPYMKALIVKAPLDFDIREVPAPVPEEEGLLVKVLACGLCGSDLRTLKHGHRKVNFPWTLGHEVCGEVIETGKKYLGKYRTGDILAIAPLVYCGHCDYCYDGRFELCTAYRELAQAWPGGFAELMAIPPEALQRGTILEVPYGMSPLHASLVEPLSSCVHAQEKGNIGLDDTVVIIGSGPIGCLHIELARSRGARKIIVADVDPSRLKFAEAFSPDYIINSEESDLVERLMEITSGRGAEVVITANPVPSTQVQAVEMAAKGGRILLFGGLPKEDATPGINTNLIHYNALSLIGTTIFAPRHNRVAMEMISSGRVSAEKIISHVFPLSDFKKGAELAMEGKALKVIFEPDK